MESCLIFALNNALWEIMATIEYVLELLFHECKDVLHCADK